MFNPEIECTVSKVLEELERTIDPIELLGKACPLYLQDGNIHKGSRDASRDLCFCRFLGDRIGGSMLSQERDKTQIGHLHHPIEVLQ